jgi:hypothetical protein
MNSIAEPYVKLVLELGERDAGYVDAYYGPPAWKEEAAARHRSLADIHAEALSLVTRLDTIDVAHEPEIVRLRRSYLRRQLDALASRVEMLEGQRFSFDEESNALYDGRRAASHGSRLRGDAARARRAPPGHRRAAGARRSAAPGLRHPDREARGGLQRRDRRVPRAHARARQAAGEGALHRRVRDRPAVERLQLVQGRRPQRHPGEHRSASHPRPRGRSRLPRGLPGASRLQLVARGSAGARARLAGVHGLSALLAAVAHRRGHGELRHRGGLPGRGAHRLREAAGAIAGIDPDRVAGYAKVQRALQKLSYAGNEAARRYLDGQIDAKAAADWLERYALTSPRARAEQRVRFFDTYRSYVINYNLGQDLVRGYVEARGGTAQNPDRRWQIFADLLSSPRLPADLQAAP